MIGITYRGEPVSVKSVQFSVATHIMAALRFYDGEEISSSTHAESVNADPTFVRVTLKAFEGGLGGDNTRRE
jgi:hypothetical protein